MKFKLTVLVAALLSATTRAADAVAGHLYVGTTKAQNAAFVAGRAEVQADLNRSLAELELARKRLADANKKANEKLRDHVARIDAIREKVYG